LEHKNQDLITDCTSAVNSPIQEDGFLIIDMSEPERYKKISKSN
jgi:hypothetical protein